MVFFGQLWVGNKDSFVALQVLFLLLGSIALSTVVKEQGAIISYTARQPIDQGFFLPLVRWGDVGRKRRIGKCWVQKDNLYLLAGTGQSALRREND